MCQFRDQERDKHVLKPMARAFMHRAFLAQCEATSRSQARIPLPDGALELIAAGDGAVSTANAHAPYVHKWSTWCQVQGQQDFPPDPWNVMVWLLEAATGDNSSAPTKNRCNALSWACTQMELPPVTTNTLVKRARTALLKRLGSKNEQKEPILPEHVRSIFAKHAAPLNVELAPLLNVMWLATMVEGALRWDDLSSVSLGSVCCFEGAVRLFCAQTKTDQYREGQWAVLASSQAPESAVQLIWRVIERLTGLWALFPLAVRTSLLSPSAKAPTIDPGDDTAFLCEVSMACPLQLVEWEGKSVPFPKLGFMGLMPSSEFSKVLKQWAIELGLDPSHVASHSCKIGAVHAADAAGIPDRLIVKMGRWRSEKMLGHYVGEARSTRELARHLHEKWQRSTIAEDNPGSLCLGRAESEGGV